MPGHDPFRGATDSLTSLTGQPATDAPAPLTGSSHPEPQVPKGTVTEVVGWIDNGRSAQQRQERAEAALEAEQAKAKPRKGVVEHAQAVLAG